MPKTKAKYHLALVGTDSLRGQEIKNILAQKKLPAFEIELFDPEVQEDFSKLTQFKKEPMVVHSLNPKDLEGKDLVFLASEGGDGRNDRSPSPGRQVQSHRPQRNV